MFEVKPLKRVIINQTAWLVADRGLWLAHSAADQNVPVQRKQEERHVGKLIRPQVLTIWVSCVPFSSHLIDWVSGHWLTCTVDVLETLLVWIQESLLDISVAVVLLGSLLAVLSVPVHVVRLTIWAPSPAFAPIPPGHWDTYVDGLMVWPRIWTVTWSVTWILNKWLNATLKCQYGSL